MSIRFQLLPCRVEVEADDGEVLRKLRYLSNAAGQEVRPLHAFRYSVSGHGPYEVREEGDLLQRVSTLDDVLAVVYRRCHQRALDLLALGGWSMLHGGIARVEGRRVLVVGAKGTGKSTLMLRLLFDGHAVEGDELALVRAGVVVAFPRRFRLKPGIERFVPELVPLMEDLPRTLQDGLPVAAFDPSEAGLPWRLEMGEPVDAVVMAEADHEGGSRLRELPSHEAVRRLLGHSIRIDGSEAARARLVEACSRLVREGAYELRLGDLSEATRALASLGAPQVVGGVA